MWDKASPSCWLDGEPSFSPLNWHRGLHYGDGVFRTVLKADGAIIDQGCQLEKLQRDCGILGLELDDGRAERCLLQAADGVPEAVIKLVVARAGNRRGYQSSGTGCEVLALRSPLPDYPSALWKRGVATSFSPFRLAEQPALAGAKHLNRLEQVLASRNWPPGVQERILCDMENRPISGTRTNLFWVVGSQLVTPSLSTCGVAGMMRQKILGLAEASVIDVAISRQPREALMEADEAFLSNSLIGIWPVRRLETRIWPVPGPVTRRLVSMLKHSWQGNNG